MNHSRVNKHNYKLTIFKGSNELKIKNRFFKTDPIIFYNNNIKY